MDRFGFHQIFDDIQTLTASHVSSRFLRFINYFFLALSQRINRAQLCVAKQFMVIFMLKTNHPCGELGQAKSTVHCRASVQRAHDGCIQANKLNRCINAVQNDALAKVHYSLRARPGSPNFFD